MEVLFLKMYDSRNSLMRCSPTWDYYEEVTGGSSTPRRCDRYFLHRNDFGTSAPAMSPTCSGGSCAAPQRLAGLGHDYGLKVMMHCCGGYAP